MVLRPAFAVLIALTGSAWAGEGKPRAVVELFTSQGCSSCPPADLLASELAQDPSLVVLSLPVDYWDYLGWKDTNASKAFTARQKIYGELRGDRQVYTPQAVIDGVNHTIGSNRDAIELAATTGRARPALAVPVKVDAAGETIRIAVAPGTVHDMATVMIVPLSRRSEVSITRGENKGKLVTYINVVRDLVGIGTWTGAYSTYEVPASLVSARGGDSFVVLVQQGTPDKPGMILGAAKGPGL